MERAAYMLKVKPDRQREYREVHRNVWPELIRAAHAAGLRNHTVFMKGGTLFLYIEAENLERSLKEFVASPVKAQWDRIMADYFESGDHSEDGPGAMDEVFHFD